jgi:hypothetical protein
MSFEIKAFKDWATHDGGGYQFNLYYNKKKFAFVHNDGNGGMIEMEFSDGKHHMDNDTPNGKIWDDYVKSLGQWKSSFGEINGTEWFDYDTDIAIGKLVEEYEMAKHRKKGILFRLVNDSENSFRTIKTQDADLAVNQLDKMFGKGNYLFV